MAEMTGGCLCGQVGIPRMRNPPSLGCAIARIVRNRPELRFQSWLEFQSRQ